VTTSSFVRIIPRLDVKGPNLVKGVHLEGLRVLGQPEAFARHYYEQGADELLYMDAVASLYQRNTLLHFVEATARTIFIPLTVGGGLRSIDDIRQVLRAGADKVALNTAAIRSPSLITHASRQFGSSTIVVSIEAIRNPDGSYEAFTDCGRERTGLDAIAWAIQAAELGAGELMVTSIDREGTGKGYDLDLTRRIADGVGIPVIACGGAGQVDHVRAVLQDGHADAVSLASMLHYTAIDELPRDPSAHAAEGNVEFMKRGQSFSRVERATLPEIKRALDANGIACRVENVEVTRG
jgi:cyclase